MNLNALIVVADSARARLFRMERTDAPRAPIALREAESLVHPEARVKEGERHSGSFPAAVRPGKGGQGHRLDDHRGAHEAEERRRFAKAIAQTVARSVKQHSNNPVIVVATHALHAVLGAELQRDLPKEVHVRSEIGEFSELTPAELLEELEHRGAFQP
jgi:protein required for attachment to host cells